MAPEPTGVRYHPDPAERESFVFESVRTPRKTHLLEDSDHQSTEETTGPRLPPDMEPFTVHDLRRGAATNWAERLGAEERTIEVCPNHQPVNKLVRSTTVPSMKRRLVRCGCAGEGLSPLR